MNGAATAESINQGDFIFCRPMTQDSTADPFLVTLGCGPYLCVALFSPETKTTTLTHIDTAIDEAAFVRTMVDQCRNIGEKSTVCIRESIRR
ncbi:hypothetical protein [Coxiella endosymbiont of Ornithodoros maritimus]|uniref:hypothetical protein n=1 Tax=Coxiella endosymbiont of Ornithodoros maritimus TaxID=1656172 RepID=UPI0022649D0B|nr:hypothetical protein [Coxiella endosymbiont of Ornithodoros maritimus]